MADDDALPSNDTRSERLLRSRRKRRLLAIAAAGAAALVAGSVMAAFALADDSEARPDNPANGTDDTLDKFDDEVSRLSLLAERDPKRALSHDDPLRLWIGGDSLAGALGLSLGDLTRDTGIIDTKVDYKVSSGLASDGPRDWDGHAADAMAEQHPEAVVFMVGTNDASIVNRRLDASGVPEWEPGYREAVGEMMDLLVGDGEPRTVVWIGAPPMRESWRDRGVVELNRVMREEAAKRAPHVVFLDAYRLFAGPDGGYASEIETDDGEVRRVRVGDGVHFTMAGGQHLASEVFDLLDAWWRIRGQADPEHPIGFDVVGNGEYDWYDPGDDDEDGYVPPTAEITSTTVAATTTSSAPAATSTTGPAATTTTAPAATTTTAVTPTTEQSKGGGGGAVFGP